jgi:photosystem II stability/assembly factor-like uncharacterized protein
MSRISAALCREQMLGLIALAISVHGAVAAPPDEALRQRPMCADAQLADVCFVDAEHGWAAGDRGTIWHTVDGGRHWSLQTSGVDCRLSSVVFLDRKIGWAAGGSIQPFTHTSTGVILRTQDGGEHWTWERRAMAPAIVRIGFFDPLRGWALGQPSALFPSGVMLTDDGGRTWLGLPATKGRNWLTGAMVDPHTGALAGSTSASATIRKRTIEPQPADFGLRALRAMQLVAPAKGWLVGDGGLILQTRDLGKSWQTTEGALPDGVNVHFDFSAVAVRGPHCWVAGTPGTRVFYSPDEGATWSACDTGQTLPIRALSFVDAQNGWAVGDLGTILATVDGGRTWRQQRAGGQRAAYVGFFGRNDNLPLELVAQLSADLGYLGAMEVIARDDVEAQGGVTDRPRQAQEATVRAGASAAMSAWRFPLRQSGLQLSAEQLLEGWNQANDSEALAKLEAHLVSRIRMWRPNVVFTSNADGSGGDRLAHVINQAVLHAVEAAADAASHREQISQAGLQPWRVQKVFAALPPGENGTLAIDPAQLSPRYGRTLGELAAAARGMIADRYEASGGPLGFRLLVDGIPQDVGRREFFSGISLSAGGEARRMMEAVADSDLQQLHREATRRRNLQAILERAETADPSDGRFLADVGEQTRAMQPERAGEVLLALAERYQRSGRWEMACECYALVVDRYPEHPLCGVALAWLIQYHASGEVAWHTRSAEGLMSEEVALAAPARVPQVARPTPGAGVHQGAALAATNQVQLTGGVARDLRANPTERFTKTDNYSKQLEQLQPAQAWEPAVRFPWAVAQRELGLPRQAERFYLGVRQNRPDDAWRACAETELWLIDAKNDPPKTTLNCPPTIDKPRLDGQLDEPLWKSGSRAQLKSALGDDSQWPAVVMLAYDREFLYVAVSCTRAPGAQPVRTQEPRPRDPDLSNEDRVELLLDMDRDFATFYRLSIDHRGWTGETCWGDKSWNPKWFVASGESENAWTAEAAIAWSDLASEPPTVGKAWAIGIQRVVPGVGFQSWTTPAAVEAIGEGFGYLMFR